MIKIYESFIKNWFFKVVVFFNGLVVITAMYWAYKEGGFDNLEPIVASMGAVGVLLGLFYVNNKVSRPNIKVRFSSGIAFQGDDYEDTWRIHVSNYSLNKVFLSDLSFKLSSGECATFAFDNYGKPIAGAIVESGETKSFDFRQSKWETELNRLIENKDLDVNHLFVRDQLGHCFRVPKHQLVSLKQKIKKAATE